MKIQKMTVRILPLLTALFIAQPALADMDHHKSQSIEIDDAWVAAAPKNAPALAMFMEIENESRQDLHLLRAEGTGFARVELHRSMPMDGMMKMVPQDRIAIPAKGKVKLRPGDYHIMLIGPDRVPDIGERVMLTLVFDNGEQLPVHAVVRPRSEHESGMMTQDHHDHMHHH
jgi:copper(I)-binding protein